MTPSHRLPVVKANADVDGLVVEEHLGLGSLAYGLPLFRIDLGEIRHRHGRGPCGLVQPAVNLYGHRRTGRFNHGPGRTTGGLVLLGCQGGGEEGEEKALSSRYMLRQCAKQSEGPLVDPSDIQTP